jgi:hypothetical protein
MKYFVVFFNTSLFYRNRAGSNTFTKLLVISTMITLRLANVNVININKKWGARTEGYFEIDVQPSDTLHFSL